MSAIILTILGVTVSALYVGFLAYSIGAVPLWIIVIATYILAIRELTSEWRENGNAASRNGNGRNR